MKKIGLVTFHASHNNGSMLQALALQHILEEKYLLPVEILDFSNEAQRNMYAPLPKATNWKKAIKRMLWMTNYRQMIKQYNAYNAFRDKYFHLSKDSFASEKDLMAVEGNYRAFIAGSDQVWNIRCTDADDVYYLNFVKSVPQYAYAVSFGANNPFLSEKGEEYYASLIKAFNRISVREKNAQKWIGHALHLEVPVCLDPTMLMDRENWEKLVDVGEQPVIDGDYIFYYCFSITNEIQSFLNRTSKKYHMPVYFMDAKEWTLKACWRNRIHLIKEYGPAVYMNVVKNAKIFITTSFHGTAFATIYEKCFWYLDDGKNDPEKDDRALTLLTQLSLLDRYKSISEMNEINLLSPKDYSETKQRLALLQAQSFAFIDAVVGEIESGK